MATDERCDSGVSSEPEPIERVYLWEHVIFFQAHSFSIGGPETRVRRLSVALIVANRSPFQLLVEGELRQFQAVLASPRVPRGLLRAQESDLTIVEINVAHPAYHRLRPRFSTKALVSPTPEEIHVLQELLRPDFFNPLSCSEVRQRFADILGVLGTKNQAPAQSRDPRIEKILQLVEQTPFDEVSTKTLASAVFMSESRLRHFFKEQMDCTLGQYIRWANALKAMLQWRHGFSLNEAATATGFYDRAHLNRAMREQLFDALSIMANAKGLCIYPCDRSTCNMHK